MTCRCGLKWKALHQPLPTEPIAMRYHIAQIALHWLMALLIVGLLGVGLWMTDLKLSPTSIQIYTWHKWGGLTVLVLVALRLPLRLTLGAPALPTSTPAWQRRAAAVSHGLLYALMVAMPLTGWLQNSAAGFPLTWFGLFKVPALIARDREAFGLWQDVHGYLAYALIALIAVHIAAAVKHHWFDRDGVSGRMWPAKRSGR